MLMIFKSKYQDSEILHKNYLCEILVVHINNSIQFSLRTFMNNSVEFALINFPLTSETMSVLLTAQAGIGHNSVALFTFNHLYSAFRALRSPMVLPKQCRTVVPLQKKCLLFTVKVVEINIEL